MAKRPRKAVQSCSSCGLRSPYAYGAGLVVIIMLLWMYISSLPDSKVLVTPKQLPGEETPYSKEQYSCEQAGGRWGQVGLSREPRCTLPTKDAGKACWDSSECEGMCVASVSQADVNRANGRLRTNGTCSGMDTKAGCNAVVQKGYVRGILCID